MKKIVLSIVILLCSCAQVQQFSAQEAENNKITLQIAKDLLPVAETQIGFFKGCGKADEYTVEAVKAMDELLELAAADPNTLSNYQLGYSLGLRAKLTELLLKYAISRYLP